MHLLTNASERMAIQDLVQINVEDRQLTDEVVSSHFHVTIHEAKEILEDYVQPIAEATLVTKIALDAVLGILNRVEAFRILKEQCREIAELFERAKPILIELQVIVDNCLRKTVSEVKSLLKKESVAALVSCIVEVKDKIKECEAFVKRWEERHSRKFLMSWFRSHSHRDELDELVSNYEAAYRRLTEQLTALGFVANLKSNVLAEEWRENFDKCFEAEMSNLTVQIDKLWKSDSDKAALLTERIEQVHSVVLNCVNANEKQVTRFDNAYKNFQSLAKPLFDELFPNVRHKGVQFPLQITLKVEQAFARKDLTLIKNINLVRLAGRSFASICDERFLMSNMRYMKQRGFAEASNVLKVTAALDSVNWKMMHDEEFGNWYFGSFTHVLALSAMSQEIAFFSILSYWNPGLSKQEDPFDTDFMKDLKIDIEKNICHIQPLENYAINALHNLVKSWNENQKTADIMN